MFILYRMMTLDQIVSMNESQTKHLSWNKLDKSLKLKRMMVPLINSGRSGIMSSQLARKSG
jgi:hypothetical protein